MKPRIKIKFVDFWSGFNDQDNYFIKLLSQRFSIDLSEDPEFLIYSAYGENYLKYNCYKIFYNAENQRINWNACDYAFSFDYLDDDRHYRLPNWILYDNPAILTLPKPDPNAILSEQRKFCNFIVSNPYAEKRISFFEKLSKYKKVDSGGKHLNNISSIVGDKRAFLRNYKFSIAFENSSYPGYTTEKLFEPMLENSIPIYWGNPLVNRDFNTKSFINYHEYGSDEAVIERVIALDQNDELYIECLSQPWYNNNEMPGYLEEKSILAQFEIIFLGSKYKKPVAQTFRQYINKCRVKLLHLDNSLNQHFRYRRNFR